jgi:integrase
MAIYQRSKSYYYDFVYKGQRYVGNIGPVSRTVAKEEEIKKKRAVIEGILNPAKARKSPRLEAFAQEYLDWLRTNRQPRSVLRAEHAFRWLLPTFGQKKLNELTSWHVEQYKKTRKEYGASISTLNIELAFLRATLKKAHEWKRVADLPSIRLLKAPEGRTRFLSEEEEAAILAVCSPALQRVIETGLLTGFRRQELVTLRPEDLDFQRSMVTVAACYSKNGASRTLPMGERLQAILHDAVAVNGDAPTVFVTDMGQPWSLSALTEALRRVSQRAGIPAIGPHVLRHTFASRLVMAGVDLPTVQALMGHKSILMTMRYTHLSGDHKRAALETLEQRFSQKKSHQFSQHPALDVSPVGAKVVAIR